MSPVDPQVSGPTEDPQAHGPQSDVVLPAEDVTYPPCANCGAPGPVDHIDAVRGYLCTPSTTAIPSNEPVRPETKAIPSNPPDNEPQ